MTQPMTRSNAVLAARITRASVVVLGVGAVALGLTGLPDRPLPPEGSTLGGHGVPPGMTPGGAGTGGTGEVRSVAFSPVDGEGMAARFAQLDNAPKILDAKGVTVATEAGPVDLPVRESPAAGAIVDRVRFLGVVRLGDRDAAFINVDGRQRFVQEGARLTPPVDRPEFAELIVERITPTTLMVGDGARSERLGLAARVGPAVTMADGGIVNRVELPAAEPAPSNMRQMPQHELDRRARMMERQRSGTLGELPPSRSAPPVRATIDARGRNRPAAENADE